MKKLIALLLLIALSSAQAAPVTYTYNGGAFQDKCSEITTATCPNDLPVDEVMGLTIGITVEGLLAPNARHQNSTAASNWFVSDGYTTLTGATGLSWVLNTDSEGAVEYWHIQSSNLPLQEPALEAIQFFSKFDYDPLSAPAPGVLDEGSAYLVSEDGLWWEAAETNNYVVGPEIASLWSITVVPIPAAVWLFGSALGLLAWIRSRI